MVASGAETVEGAYLSILFVRFWITLVGWLGGGNSTFNSLCEIPGA